MRSRVMMVVIMVRLKRVIAKDTKHGMVVKRWGGGADRNLDKPMRCALGLQFRSRDFRQSDGDRWVSSAMDLEQSR